MNGYAHPAYAQSMAEFGLPLELPSCGGWVLRRPILDTLASDAMGCYPLFCCRDWLRLGDDLNQLRGTAVCLSLVADPFGNYDVDLLRSLFDIVRPFKLHFVADLAQPVNELAPKYHRKHARKALRESEITISESAIERLDEWNQLYQTLVRRHQITGMRAFSRTSFALQLQVPGAVMFRALRDGVCIGAHLWYQHVDVAYSHLSAYSDEGYKMRISYGLNWAANDYFARKVRWLDLGASAGLSTKDMDGLSLFKKGFATGTRQAFFCGTVFDHSLYDELTKTAGSRLTDYFPAYRKGEFA